MKPRTPIAGLDEAIEQHAGAIAHGNFRAAEGRVAPGALEAHRAACATIAAQPPGSFTLLARARIGFQYVAKLRWPAGRTAPGSAALVLQNRWRREGERWQIVEVDDLSRKRSPWSDLPRLQNSPVEAPTRNA